MKTVGSVVGVGGGSNKPVTVQTAPDPNIAKLLEQNQKLFEASQAAKTSGGVPTWVWIAGAGVAVLGVFLLVRRN